MKTHGYSLHPNYNRWNNVNERCFNPNQEHFADYGGRGITVCPEWRKEAGPKAFCDYLDDNLGTCPEGMSLDRFPNNDGNYEPGNVRWATRKQQTDNRRTRKPDKPHRKQSNLTIGVSPNGKRFMSRIGVNGKMVYLGTYDTPEQASDVFQHSREMFRMNREFFEKRLADDRTQKLVPAPIGDK